MSADTQQRMGEAVSAQAGVASFLLEWKLLLEQPSSGCAVTGGRGWGEMYILVGLGWLSQTSLLVKYCLLIAFSASLCSVGLI